MHIVAREVDVFFVLIALKRLFNFHPLTVCCPLEFLQGVVDIMINANRRLRFTGKTAFLAEGGNGNLWLMTAKLTKVKWTIWERISLIIGRL